MVIRQMANPDCTVAYRTITSPTSRFTRHVDQREHHDSVLVIEFDAVC
jgi:hypothetical protein